MGTLIITAGVSAQKVINADDQPDAIPEAILNAVINNRNIPKRLVMAYQSGIKNLVDDYFDYGKNSMQVGLPAHTSHNNTVVQYDRVKVQAVLEELLFFQINMLSAWVGYASPMLIAMWWLQENADYEIYYTLTKWTDLVDEVEVYREDPTTYIIDVLDNRRRLKVRAAELFNSTLTIKLSQWNNESVILKTLTIDTSLIGTGFNDTTILHHVGYVSAQDPKGKTFYWVYNPADATYPTLDLPAGMTFATEYYPITPIKVDDIYVDEFTNARAVQKEENTHLLKLLNMDMAELTQTFKDHENENDFDNIALLFAVDVNSDVDIELRYMYEAFKAFESLYGYNAHQIHKDWIAAGADPFDEHFHIFTWSDASISTEIKFNYISVSVQNSAYDFGGNGDPDINTVYGYGLGLDTNLPGEGEVIKSLMPGSDIIIYRRKLTANTHIQMYVRGLTHTTQPTKRTDPVVVTMANMELGGLYWPISRNLAQSFNGIDENQLYYASITLVSYTIQKEHLSGWQDGTYISFIAIALAVITFGKSLEVAAATWSSGTAVVGTTTVVVGSAYSTAALIYAVETFVVAYAKNLALAYVMEQGLSALADVIGGDAALFLAAVAGVLSIKYKGTAKPGEGIFSAEALMNAAHSGMLAGYNKVIEGEFLKLQDDFEDFAKSSEEMQEELDRARDLLTEGVVQLDLYEFITHRAIFDLAESPASFYNRTIHTGNPGVLSLNIVETYVQDALKLPRAPSIGALA